MNSADATTKKTLDWLIVIILGVILTASIAYAVFSKYLAQFDSNGF